MKSAQKPQYPQQLEAFWVEHAQSMLEGKPLRVLRSHVEDLSVRFTSCRPDHFSNYLRSNWSLLAYGLYFFPQSWVRLRYPLEELFSFRSWKPKGSKGRLRILDLGAGLGGVGLSALSCFYEHSFDLVDLHAVDHSPHALEALTQAHVALYSDFWPQSRLYTHRQSMLQLGVDRSSVLKERYDLILMGFSLNESHAGAPQRDKQAFIEKCVSLLNTSGILLILEPALKETAESLRVLSDTIIAKKVAFNWGPYPGQTSCPFLASGTLWTHEVRTWTPPRSVQQVGLEVAKHLNELKFSFSALGASGPQPIPKEGHTVRLVAPVYANKSMYLLKGVAQDGYIHTYELQRREASKEDTKNLKNLERGDLIHLMRFKDLPPEHHHRLEPDQGTSLLCLGAVQSGPTS